MKTVNQSIIRIGLPFAMLFISLSWCSCQKTNTDSIVDEEEELVPDLPYTIVGTNQSLFFNNTSEITEPQSGDAFFGQNANYQGLAQHYRDNGDGTISDLNTGLMWQQDPGEKVTYDDALAGANDINLGGYNDWRLPSIKELYSLMQFNGTDPSAYDASTTNSIVPFINDEYFNFTYGDPDAGDRIIDSQYATSNIDVGDSNFGGGNLMFGVNFADGRIKGYPTGARPGQTTGKLFCVLYVRGNTNYGVNDFVDNGDGTISDRATGLMWMMNDNAEGVTWESALSYAENLELAGHDDWRLPDAKELQSILDYTRAPGTTNSAAIHPLFKASEIINEDGQDDYAYYWSSTTHMNHKNGGQNAVYFSFGRALGYFNGQWMDVHGAGAQRSDPKSGDANDWPYGHGPQGDAIRILNFVRCVRTVK
ncbi:DUF1566 domain-containing protein [Carboxylicivirga sp. N1Y90]|uniref:Lcl C-terminal domain-containing protein n=1 Tax=Carboxylicivirga fragile TaxID=3417571 RepID=UPI003D341DF7|nr:DUF1566 domain-containing protein [Marinilabiliaceae bacterium N1Y90]